AEVGRRADLAEEVVPAELAVGVPRDPAEQEIPLDISGPTGLVEEGPGQAPRPDLHRRAEQPQEGSGHRKPPPRSVPDGLSVTRIEPVPGRGDHPHPTRGVATSPVTSGTFSSRANPRSGTPDAGIGAWGTVTGRRGAKRSMKSRSRAA